MTRIAVPNDCEDSVVIALQSVGEVSLIPESHSVDPHSVDQLCVDPLIHDALVVDWRKKDILTAMSATQAITKIPCIAVIDANQSIPDSLTHANIADLVTLEDIRSTAFSWRLKGVCRNYRTPQSLAIPHCPDNAFLNFAIDHFSDWVIVKDLEHRFLVVSEDFAATVGLPRDKIIGKNDLEIGTDPVAVHGDPKTGWLGFWAQDDAVVKAGKVVYEDNQDWRAFSLSRRYKQTIRVPLRNASGDIFALLVIVSDITDRVQAERHLQSRNLMLDRVTEEKFKAEQHRKTAEKAVRAKNKFLAAASHDLRQPLHALGLFLAVLERRITNNRDQEVLHKIRQSSESLNSLFNSLLDISRLDAGVVELSLETFLISELLINIRDEFIQLGQIKSLQVSVEITNVVVHTDRILLSRILRNLLQNAITYTEKGYVSVRSRELNGQLIIDVSDTGPGIPESQHETIFSEYYQLNSELSQSSKGLGLGLAIVRKMAELLNVDIQLYSVVGKGSCFSVSVPLGQRNNVIDSDTPMQGHHLAGLKVLVIDDEPDIRQALSLFLEAFKCHTICAESAEQAVQAIDTNQLHPDIMIVDYQLLRGNTGDAAIEYIRDHYQRYIPAIIVTGDTSNERLLDARQTGYLLLHKPVDINELIKTLTQAMEEQALAIT